MATVWTRTGREEWSDEDPRIMAYSALYAAAERIGLLSGQIQMAAHLKARHVRRTFRYVPPRSQMALVEAMPSVLAGTITPAEAMGLLWGYEVMRDRGLNP